jgi:hypothetical protein
MMLITQRIYKESRKAGRVIVILLRGGGVIFGDASGDLADSEEWRQAGSLSYFDIW